VEGEERFVGEMEGMEARGMGRHSRPNRCWPNHHRDFFAFGTEKRDELLCGGIFDAIRYVRSTRVRKNCGEPNMGNGRTVIGHVFRIDRVTPEADPTLTGTICVVDRWVTIIKARWTTRSGAVHGRGAIR
jgi:hypothetical protein